MVTFYSMDCPHCKVLKALLDRKQIEYKLVDDSNTVLSVAEKNNIQSIPFLQVDDKFYIFQAAKEWIKQQ